MKRDYEQPTEQFRQAMIVKLELNDHKAHWREADLRYLQERLHQEVTELDEAINTLLTIGGKVDPIMEESADVGNLAMMIYDNMASHHIYGSTDAEELEPKREEVY